jgi:cell pole-organizing protein PopZ
MSKADKAGEPSMEEILASIRKIIAEEPVGQRQEAQAAAATDAPVPKGPAGAASPGKASGVGAHTAKTPVDDVLDMVEPEAAPAAASRNGMPSWLFPNPQAAAAQPARGPEAPRTARVEPAANGAAAPPRETPKPFFPSARVEAPPADQTTASAGKADSGSAANGAATAQTAELGDLGAVVPRQGLEPGPASTASAAAAPAPASATVERRTPQARLPERTAKAAVSATAAEPLAAPAEPTKVLREPAAPVSGPALAELASARQKTAQEETQRPTHVSVPARGPAAAVTMASPPDGQRAADGGIGTPQSPAAASSAPAPVERASGAGETDVRAEDAAKAAAEIERGAATTPVASANDRATSVPTRVAAASEAPQGNGSKDKAEAATEPRLPVAASEPAAPVHRPTVLADKARSPRNGAPAESLPTAAQPTAVRTLDDMIIELLRPMIRQWLDENMPRMVEKALRIELAASVKPKGELPKH